MNTHGNDEAELDVLFLRDSGSSDRSIIPSTPQPITKWKISNIEHVHWTNLNTFMMG